MKDHHCRPVFDRPRNNISLDKRARDDNPTMHARARARNTTKISSPNFRDWVRTLGGLRTSGPGPPWSADPGSTDFRNPESGWTTEDRQADIVASYQTIY
jgi:hypothetical protein